MIRQEAIHPEYGTYSLNKEYDVHWFHREAGKIVRFENYRVHVGANTAKTYDIVNVSTGKVLTPCDGTVTLCHDKYKHTITVVNIILSSVFPNLDPVELVKLKNPKSKVKDPTIDHINTDFDDNSVSNLRWLTWSENAKLGQQKAAQLTRQAGGRYGIWVEIYENDPCIFLTEKPIGRLRSINKTAEQIMKIRKEWSTSDKKSTASKIGEVLRGERKSAFEYFFKQVIFSKEKEDPDEEWIQCYCDNRYMVSSKGKARGPDGNSLAITRCRGSSRYSTVMISGKRTFIHRLVWFSFNKNSLPSDDQVVVCDDDTEPSIEPSSKTRMVICHDDTAPLMEDGSYRNWLVDLSFGSHSQNMIDWHRTTADGTNTFDQFREETGPASSASGVPDEIVGGSATARVSVPIYPVEIIPEAPAVRTFANPLERLMDKPPQYVQYWKASPGNGSKYVLNKLSGLCEKDLKSVSSMKVSDKVKFLQTLYRMGHSDYQGLIQYLNDDERKVLFTIISK